MPLIVDREKVRLDILMAFERCMKDTPMMNVSLRDIAREAGMSHANLLNYFNSKDDLIVSYVRYVRDFVSRIWIDWFAAHSRKRYKSNINYINAFMSYVVENSFGENRPNALAQVYVLTHYNPDIKEAEVMVTLIVGTLICNYCDVHTGRASDNMVSLFGNLIDQ